MGRFLGSTLTLCAAVAAVSSATLPVSRFTGKFVWVKYGKLPAATARALGSAEQVKILVTFPHDVKLKPDGRGNTWFTFILADQGSDWKWHQTKGYGGVPSVQGVIKAGRYTVPLSLDGLPGSVLKDKMQTISLGPSTSGLAAPISFTVDLEV